MSTAYKIDPAVWRKIVMVLPQPDYVEVDFLGKGIDYSLLESQLRGAGVYLRNHSSELLARLFDDLPEGTDESKPRIRLKEAGFYIGDKPHKGIIRATPYEFKAEYYGNEPDLVKKLREKINSLGTNVPFTINANFHLFE